MIQFINIGLMKKEIKNKKNALINEAKEIENIKKGNKLLEGVQKKYKEYYDVSINEKQQQYDSMKLLQSYLEDLIKTDKITKMELKTAKYEQKQILDELDKIKMELDQIITI